MEMKIRTAAYKVIMMDAQHENLMNAHTQDGLAQVKLWHLTQNTPRTPAEPRAGETVTLWFGTSPVLPGLDVFVVLEKAGADRLEELPLVERAVLDHSKEGHSFWRCEVGPFPAGRTIAYFAVGNWWNRELACGEQHWFRVAHGPPGTRRGKGKEVDHEEIGFDVGSRVVRAAVVHGDR
jgi:hypothetical protein